MDITRNQISTKEGVEKHFLDLECVRSASKPRKSKGRTVIQLNVDVCSCQRKQFPGKKTHQVVMSTSKNRDMAKVIKNLRGRLLQHRTANCDLKLPPPLFSIFNLFKKKSPSDGASDQSHSKKRKAAEMNSAFSNLKVDKSFLTKLEDCITTALEPVNAINKELHQQKLLNKRLRQKLGQQDCAMTLIENLQKTIGSLRRTLGQRL